jgi:hypothetical protein
MMRVKWEKQMVEKIDCWLDALLLLSVAAAAAIIAHFSDAI